MRFVSAHVVHPYSSIHTTTTWKKSRFILSKRSDFYMIDNLSITVALLANTHAQAKSLLHSLEQTAESIGLYVNANKTEFMYFKRKGAISTLSVRHRKLVDKFTYLGINISSTESEVNIRLSVYLPVSQYTHTHTHTYIYIYMIKISGKILSSCQIH